MFVTHTQCTAAAAAISPLLYCCKCSAHLTSAHTCVRIVCYTRECDQNRYLKKSFRFILELLAIASDCIANKCTAHTYAHTLLHHLHFLETQRGNFAQVFQYVRLCVRTRAPLNTVSTATEHLKYRNAIVALYSFLCARCPQKNRLHFSIAIKHLSILIFHTFVHTSVMILSISNVSNSMYSVLYLCTVVHVYRIMSLFVKLLFNIEMFHRYFPLICIAIVRKRRKKGTTTTRTYETYLLRKFRSKWQKFVIYNNGFFSAYPCTIYNIVAMSFSLHWYTLRAQSTLFVANGKLI